MAKPTEPLAVLTAALRLQVALGHFTTDVRATGGSASERLEELVRRWGGRDLAATVYILEAAEKAVGHLTREEAA